MTAFRKFRHRLLNITELLAIAMVVATCLMGCPGPKNPTPSNNQPGTKTPQPTPVNFAWDTIRREPRWRSSSPIKWTTDMALAISSARSGGKPILAYISRYDSSYSANIEDVLLRSDMWGNSIKDNFVTLEINWWEDPALAQTILVSDQAPALVVLKVSPDEKSNELKRLDAWSGKDLLAFPLHGVPVPVADPKALEKIKSFANVDWATLKNPTYRRMESIPRHLSIQPFRKSLRKSPQSRACTLKNYSFLLSARWKPEFRIRLWRIP